MVDRLEEKLKDLPAKPGCYVMLDDRGEVIYVGKAKILKNRVRQYFQSNANKTEKTIALVQNIRDFYYYIAPSESNALVLESNLIKKYKPKYNILLKDDKNYPYLKIDNKSRFPKIEITRRIKKDRAEYYGPYMLGVSVSDLKELVEEAFSLRSCNLNFDKIPKSHRPCMNYHIHRCFAPCDGRIAEAEYGENLALARAFLKGETDRISEILTDKMNKMTAAENFERAIDYREKLKIVAKIKDKKIASFPRDVDMDVFTFVTDGANSCISNLIIRQGRMQGGETFAVLPMHSLESEVISTFLMQYYDHALLPDEIVVNCDFDTSALEGIFSERAGKKVNIISPKMGLRKQILDMCVSNGEDFLEKSIDKEKLKVDKTVGASEMLSHILNLKHTARRIECYDISNISGTFKVASMVVFFDGEKQAKSYRKFKIDDIEGSNDFACMQEVLTRRLKRLSSPDNKDESFATRPDLIVVDGGKGQLSSALAAMDEVGENIPLISLAKREEEIFVPYESEPIVLPRASNALKLLQRLRDESHRFAITFHRSLRESAALVSVLDKIEGIGKAKKAALIEKFRTLNNIKEASIKELCEVKGISAVLADSIYKKLHEEEHE